MPSCSDCTWRVVGHEPALYGGNLDVLRRHIADEPVDPVYLDPPFNSSRSYNVISGRDARAGNGAAAQIQAFDDTRYWTPVTDQQSERYVAEELPARVADALTAFRTFLGKNDAMAYLANMAPRLVELRAGRKLSLLMARSGRWSGHGTR